MRTQIELDIAFGPLAGQLQCSETQRDYRYMRLWALWWWVMAEVAWRNLILDRHSIWTIKDDEGELVVDWKEHPTVEVRNLFCDAWDACRADGSCVTHLLNEEMIIV